MSQRRFIIALVIAIPAFWFLMMALLLRREAFVPRLTPSQMTGFSYAEVPTDTWMGIFLKDGSQIGYVNVRTRPGSRGQEPGATMTIVGRLRITMLDAPTEMLATGQTWISAEQGIRDFSFSVRSGDHVIDVSGTVDGGTLRARVDSAGETYPIELPIQNDLRLSSGMGFNTMNMPVLQPGDEFLIDTFDPLTLSMGTAKIACVGVETIAIQGESVEARVVTTTVSGIKTRAWVSDKGDVLRADTPMGFVIERVREEDALHGLVAQKSTDSFTQLASVHPTGQTPFRGARRMAVQLDGLDPGQTLPEDETQRRGPGGRVTIEMPSATPPADAPVPPEDIRRDFLGNDPFVQTGSPRIRETAQDIVGDATGSWPRARLIYDWVYANVEKTAVLSVPSALDVLETKQGDCNEHTVLYTALARAAGIPTRIAIGIVWSEYYHAFYYHAWPEVYVDRWYWVDPTLGQPLADATHIKLLNGGIETWWQLVPFLGQIQIQVDEIE